MNLSNILGQHAKSRPDHPVLVDGDRVVTYLEFLGIVAGLTQHLRSEGIAAGDVVGVTLPDSIAYLATVYALARLGAILQPIDGDLAVPERDALVRNFATRAIIADRQDFSISGLPTLCINDGLLNSIEDESWANDLSADPELPFELSFSSGTTGTPKAFLVTHSQQFRRFAVFKKLGVGVEDRYLVVTSMRFNMGLRCAMAMVQLGGTVILNQGIDTVERLVAVCGSYGATWSYIMPAHIRQLLLFAGKETPLLPTIRYLLVGGSQLWRGEREAARQKVSPNLFEIYGANEVGIVTYATPDDQISFPESIGQPFQGVELEVVDLNHQPVTVGTTGQIRFRHPGMVTNYLNNKDASKRVFHLGWFYSGDLAYRNAQGCLFFRGRLDDVINIDGTKFYPVDTEFTLLAHPKVVEAAVIGVPWRQRREVVLAFVVVQGPLCGEELIEFCRGRIAVYKVPDQIFVVDEMPRTATGKIAKRLLTESIRQTGLEITTIRSPFESS